MARPFPVRLVPHGLPLLILTVWLSAVACNRSTPPEPVERPAENTSSARPVRVLVIDDQRLGQALQREWLARSEQPLEVIELSSAQVLASPTPTAAELVIYPSGLIGTLVAQGQIEPLPETALSLTEWQRDDLFELVRLQETTWAADDYAVPFGSPQLTLWYRRDILERLGVAPPTTWSEYQQLAERLAKPEAFAELVPESKSWAAVAEPWGPGWAGLTLLSRAASAAWNPSQLSALFDRRTMQPSITGPAFQRALDELAATARLVPTESHLLTPAQARETFLAGNCALALTWPSAVPAPEAAAQQTVTQQAALSAPSFPERIPLTSQNELTNRLHNRHPPQSRFRLSDLRSSSSVAPSSQFHEDFATSNPHMTFVAANAVNQSDQPGTSQEASVTAPSELAVRQVGFAPLPGSADFYDTRSQVWLPRSADQPRQVPLLVTTGRLGSITRWGKRSAAAQTLLTWLGSTEAGEELGATSSETTLFRRSQSEAAQRWVDARLSATAGQQYADVVARTQRGIAWLSAPRIPGRNRYLAALDLAVQQVIRGEASSADALAEAARTWEAITTELGRDAQRDAYRQSLGLETAQP